MLGGRSEQCEAFDSPRLAGKETFQIQNMEVWALVRPS
jgi:hypothetical protein